MAKTARQYQQENEDLRIRLQEAEETLEAIRSGQVDAIVVSQGQQEQVFTLQGAETAYRIILERMNEGAAMLAADRTIVYCNARFAEVLGRSLDQVLGRPIEQYVLPADLASFQLLFRQAVQEDSRGEVRFQGRHGTPVPIYVSMNPLSLDQAAAVCMVATDLTDQKRHEQVLLANATLEQRVAERTVELERQAAQLRTVTTELTVAEHRERQRIAKVLHDHLQQLLVSARFHVSSAQSEIIDPRARQLLDQVNTLLDDSVQSSRSLTAELFPPALREGTFAEALRWLIQWMRDKHDLQVHFKADEQVNPQAEEIRLLLFEAARELLFNVVKHAGVREACLEVVRHNDEQMRLTIADSGCGFDVGSVRRADRSEGGLGLSAIQERLHLLGGRVELESTLGHGTRATLLAPLQR